MLTLNPQHSDNPLTYTQCSWGSRFPTSCVQTVTRRHSTLQIIVLHSFKKTELAKSSPFWGQIVTYSKHHLFNGTQHLKDQWKGNNTITIVITFCKGFSVHKFYFSAIHRHTLFNIVSKYVQFRIKKGVGMQVQSPEFLCFNYHLLDSVLHLINIANYNKHPNKTNMFLL